MWHSLRHLEHCAPPLYVLYLSRHSPVEMPKESVKEWLIKPSCLSAVLGIATMGLPKEIAELRGCGLHSTGIYQLCYRAVAANL